MFTYRKKMAKCRLDKEEIILADYLSKFLTQNGLTLNNNQLPLLLDIKLLQTNER
jgi:hypothetical protein